jgi:MFS family permease
MRWIDSLGPSFIYAIYPLFLRSRGLNQFQINVVAALFFITTASTDVPTGAFADAIGRRASVIVGDLVSAAAYSVYFFAHRFVFFALGEVLDGIGSTFRNGAIDAWAIDSLNRVRFAGTTYRLFSRGSQLWRFAAMTGAVIGAYVAIGDVAIPWILGTMGMLAGAGWAFSLMRGEQRRESTHQLTPGEVAGLVYERMIGGLKIGFSDRAVLLMAVANAIQLGAWSQFFVEWQHYFTTHLSSGIWIVGWLFALFSIGSMMGSEISARFATPRALRPYFLASSVALQAIILLCAGTGIGHPMAVLAMFVLRHVIDGFAVPVYQAWFNEQIEVDYRATLLSFQSTFATLGASVGLPLTGLIADSWGLGAAWQMSAMFALLGVPCYLTLRGSMRMPVTSDAKETAAAEAGSYQ